MRNKLRLLAISALLSLLPIASFGAASFQVIHNAADPALAVVDIYVNGIKILDNVSYRTATPFVNIILSPVENIGLAPANSTSVADTVKNFPLVLADGQRYVVIANGVLNPMNFASNPDGRATALNLVVRNNIQNVGSSSSVVNIIAYHGASDAPTVDVIARGVGTLFNDLSYGDFSSYDTVSNANYILDVAVAAGSPVVASFQADLTSLGGSSAVIFASGFLNPSTNQNGSAFGLFAALANGTVVPLSNITGINNRDYNNEFSIYPNPASAEINISSSTQEDNTILEISNSIGQVLKICNLNSSRMTVSIADLPKGVYFVRVQNSGGKFVNRLIVE